MQAKVTSCLGLVSQHNPLTLRDGALSRADNCSIRRENIIEDRRGHKLYSSFTAAPSSLMTYLSRVIAKDGTTLKYDNGSGTFASYSGSYSAPTNTRMRGFEAFSNLYFTTSLGVKVLTDIAGTAARSAGVARMLDPSYTLTGASGFLDNNYQCAYRCTLQKTDANSNVITGYPSQRLWVTNSAGGSRNVALTTYLPSAAVAGDVVQFFRTEKVSGVGSDSSGDEMALVYQYELVAGDISAGYITFTDSVTDALRGATLYTSPSQEGIGQANAVPPLCKDIALYKSNYMLYANTTTKMRLYFSMVGTSGLSGKTITLGGVTYNFGASEIISGVGSPQALVSATGVASVDIDLTARSLCRVINRYASNTTVYAYYLSGPDDTPGQILIEEKAVGGSAFTLQASDTTISGMFYPAPPVGTTNTKSTSANEARKNAIYYSKNQQPEHVPLLNYLLVGPSNKNILRVVPLRDSAIVIKEEGVYRIAGESPSSFSVVPIDLTLQCKAENSVVVLDNQVFMLSNQGVVAISESGAQVVSHDIEPDLIPFLQSSSLSSYTSGCAYDSDRSYFLSTISATSDTAATQTYVFNTGTKTWVRHTYAFTCGVVEPGADKMYFVKPGYDNMYVERKDFLDSDYCDPETSITITAIGSNYVDFTISTVTPDVGWVISQNNQEFPIYSIATGTSGYRATLESAPPADWTTGAATIYPNVGMDVEWHPFTAGAPETLKQTRLAALLTDDLRNDSSSTAITFKFRSNLSNDTEEVDMILSAASWGAAWGASPWGGGEPLGYVTYVPQAKQYNARISFGVEHKYARQKINIAGFAMAFRSCGERIAR